MAERSVTFSIIVNAAKARREARKTKDEFKDLQDQIDATNATGSKASSSSQAAADKNTAAVKRSVKAQKQAAASVDDTTDSVKQNTTETKKNTSAQGVFQAAVRQAAAASKARAAADRERTQASTDAAQATIRDTTASQASAAVAKEVAAAQHKVAAALLTRQQATLALEAAEARLSSVEARHGQGSSQYASALLSVNRRQLDVEASSGRYTRALGVLDDVQNAVTPSADRAGNAFQRLGQKLGVFTSKATRVPGAMKGVIAGLGGMAIKIPLILTGVGYLITAVSNLSAGVLSLLGPLGSLSGVLATLPQGFMVAAGAAATFLAAFSGIGGALKAGMEAQKGAGQAAIDTAAAEKASARAISDAQRAVKDAREAASESAIQSARSIKDALESVEDAEDALVDAIKATADARKEATQDIKDQETALRDLEFAQRGASISLEEAKLRLDEVMSNPQSTELERRAAQLSYDESVARLEDARKERAKADKELTDARKKGIEGSDTVRDAKDAEAQANEDLADAERSLADARKAAAKAAEDSAQAIADAQQNLADAYDNSAASMAAASAQADAYAEAMEGLSPAGQKFVKTLLGMRDEMKKLKFAAQEGLLPGIGEALTILLKLVPFVSKALFGFGQIIGDIAVKGAKMLTDPKFLPLFNRLLVSNEKLLRMGGNGFLNIAEAILYLMDSARPLTEWLAKTVLGWTKVWKESAKAGNETGKTAEFFERTRRVLTILGGAFKNLWTTFKNIGGAGMDLGMDLLRSFRKITGGWAEWTASTEGQNQLKEWFDAARKPLHEFSVLLGLITREIFDFGRENGDSFAEVLRTIQPLIPKLGDLMTNLQGDFGTALIESLGTLIDIFIRLTDASEGGLTSFVKTVGQVLEVVLSLLQIEAVNKAFSLFLTALGVFAALKFTGVLALFRVLGKFGGLFKGAGSGASKFNGFLSSVGKVARKVGGGLKKFGGIIGSVFKGAAKIAGNFAKSLGKGLMKAGGIVKKFGSFLGRGLLTVFKVAGRVIVGFARIMGTWLLKAGGYILKFAGIVGKAMLIVGRAMLANPWMLLIAGLVLLVYLVIKYWDKIKAAVMKAIDWVIDFVKKNWNIIKWFLGPIAVIITAIVKHWDKIKKIFKAGLNAVIKAVKKIWAGLYAIFIKPFVDAWKWIQIQWAKLKFIFSKGMDIVLGLLKKVWDSVTGFFMAPISKAWEGIQKVFGWIKGGFDKVWEKIKNGAKVFSSAFGEIWNGIQSVFAKPVEFVINTVLNDWIIGGINSILSKLKLPEIPEIPRVNAASAGKAGAYTGGGGAHSVNRNRGGTIPGEGNRDTVPAMLTPGEFVIRKDAVKRLGVGYLHALNEGKSFRGRKIKKDQRGQGGREYSIGGVIESVGKGILKKGRDFASAGAGKIFDAARAGFNKIPGSGLVHDIPVGAANKVMDSIQGWIGGAAAASSVTGAKAKSSPLHPVGVSGTATEDDPRVQHFHDGGVVQGMRRGAKGTWVKALEDLKRKPQDGTWDGKLNTALRRDTFASIPKPRKPNPKQQKTLKQWVNTADPKMQYKDKNYKVAKGDTIGGILREFYGNAKARAEFKEFLAINGFTKKVTSYSRTSAPPQRVAPPTVGRGVVDGGGGGKGGGKGGGSSSAGSSSGTHRPVNIGSITQGLHDTSSTPAIDFGVPVGTPVYSIAPGKVSASYDLPGYEERNSVQNGYRSYGKVIQIAHKGFSSLYAHLNKRGVQEGKKVGSGTPIGVSGNLGYTTGAHLHFGVSGRSPYDFTGASTSTSGGGGGDAGGGGGAGAGSGDGGGGGGKTKTTKVVGTKKWTDRLKPGSKVKLSDVPIGTGSRTWGEALNRFKIDGSTMEDWVGYMLPILKKGKVDARKYAPLSQEYGARKDADRKNYGALNERLGLGGYSDYNENTRSALQHAMAHTFKRKHDEFAYRPWQAFTPLEAELQATQAQIIKETQWQKNLTTISSWGYSDLVDYLLEKGIDDGFSLAKDAAGDPKRAKRLNDQVKQLGDIDSEDFAMLLKLTSLLSGSAGPIGLREASRHLGISDLATVKLWEKGNTQGRFKGLPAGKRSKMDEDVASYRAGTFYFASGGHVPGTGSGDTVPAMLTPGEFVIKKKAAEALGLSNLTALNNAQHFANGGMVMMSPSVSQIPTKVSVGVGGSAAKLSQESGKYVTNNFNYDVDINNPVAEPSTRSMTKMLQRQSALRGKEE